LLPVKVCSSTLDDVTPAYDFYKDDFNETGCTSILKGGFELWLIKWKVLDALMCFLEYIIL